MARAPGAVKESKDKKSRSSASEVKSSKVGKQEKSRPSSRGGAEESATASVPVKSVLKESKPAVQANVVEQDFPRGAAPKALAGPKKQAAQPAEERGLFDDGLASASKDATVTAKKRRAEGASTDATAASSSSGKATKKRKMINKNDKKLSYSSSSTPAGAEKGDTFRVEHMSYKRLVPGPTVLLVQVIAILPLELIVSMPNQLLGHVPITNISKVYTKRLEEDLEQSSDEEEEEESESNSDVGKDDDDSKTSSKLPSLEDMFHPGQYLLASVVTLLPPRATTSLIQSTGGRSQRGNEDWKASRRVELSLEPERVNAGVTKTDLKNGGICLQGTVKSVEDNGYVLSFGLASPGESSADGGLTAFVGSKEEKKGKKDAAAGASGIVWPKSRLTLGGIVNAKVTKVGENGRTATVSLFPKDVAQVQLSTPPSITSILPGTLVQATISAITPSGLNLKFLGFFEGTVDSFHLPLTSTSAYKINQKVLARTLWTSPPTNDSPIRFALSLLPHIISLTPKSAPLAPANPESEKAPINEVLPIGTFLENLEITKVEPEWGLLCTVPGTDLKAFVHISHVNDEHTTNLNTGTGGQRWKVGQEGYKGRIIGYSALDGLLQVSMQQSVLERKFMKVADLRIGEVIDGTIQRLSDTALFVNIHGSVAGIVWPLHYSDLRLKHPERKFKPGSAVKTRVLSLDAEKNRVVLTLKRSLVNSDLPVLQSIAEAQVGQVLHATVHTFLQKDMLVELFGGVRAFVPISEAADKFVSDIKKEFNLGQVLKVRITAVDLEMGRLTASVKQAMENYQPKETKEKSSKGKAKEEVPIADISGIQVGDKVTGDISEIHENQVVLALEGHEGVKALLSLASLARHRSTTAEALRADLKTGETLEQLVVVTKNPEKGLLILGHPVTASSSLFGTAAIPSRTGISANALSNLTFDDLEEGQIIDGTMGDQNPQGYFIQLAKGIRGKVRWTELADDYESVQGAPLARGTSVKVIIVDYDKVSKRIDLSMRASRLQETAEDDEEEDEEVKDPVIENIEDLENGKEVRGFVRSVSDAGVFVDIGKDLAARVQIKELFDEFVKNWKPRFTVGQLVSGKILSTNKAKKQIEMTFRKNASTKRAKKDTEPTVTFEGLSDGQVIKGIVKRVENYGAFIRIQGSNISGLCYKNEFSDDPKEDWTQMVNLGDLVRTVIIELDVEKRKISFSMKPSKMPEEEEEEEQGDDGYKQKLHKLVELQEAADEESDEEEDSDDDLQIMMDEEGAEALGSEEDNEDDGDEDEADESVAQVRAPSAPVASSSKAPLKLSAFKWDGQVEDRMDVDGQGEDAASDDESADSEAEAEAASKAKKNKKNGILVDDKTGDLANQLPTSASDYDRLLLASPNSSYTWIQYMSYYLQLSDTEQARQIGQRALKTINYREEEERLNVWIAIINLENTYGSETSLDEIVNKAIQNNDPKKVYLRTLEVFETTAKYEKEQELFERFVKKFNMSSKAWTLYGQFLLNRGRSTEARDLLPRSLKSLPKRKHVKTISQFALMEFKSGESERGRTIFEGIVDTYPKRLDLWWIYIDQEIRLRNTAGVRALFDRVLATKLSSKKTKSLLKKWLAFEKQHGDDAGAEAVKQRAIAYVAQLQA